MKNPRGVCIVLKTTNFLGFIKFFRMTFMCVVAHSSNSKDNKRRFGEFGDCEKKYYVKSRFLTAYGTLVTLNRCFTEGWNCTVSNKRRLFQEM